MVLLAQDRLCPSFHPDKTLLFCGTGTIALPVRVLMVGAVQGGQLKSESQSCFRRLKATLAEQQSRISAFSLHGNRFEFGASRSLFASFSWLPLLKFLSLFFASLLFLASISVVCSSNVDRIFRGTTSIA